jgi:hypothetical protein
MDEKRMLIQMIRDYGSTIKVAELRAMSMQELTAIYKSLRGY